VKASKYVRLWSDIELTSVARMKIRTDGITSGRFSVPVVLRLRRIVPTDLTKSVMAIPDVIDEVSLELGIVV
jgi:hypothetical protein